ncbi:MAG: hypothetical protein BWY67_00387 [Bacteroidetes bacterium ADurb.Bin397]|nr:MAG: hypothetical protein BWY67_00387 [Bacteroidetes bacterium ADurb.Bin397]
MYKLFCLLVSVLCGVSSINAQLVKEELFSVPRNLIMGDGQFNFKIAVNSEEVIAFNSCNRPVVYFIRNGKVTDSLKLEYKGCIRNMEFDENDNLLIMDNEEKTIYRYSYRNFAMEKLPYNKPEDWFIMQNHWYKFFEIGSVPTFYNNREYLQDFYYTRFDYSYNLYLNYSNGYIYQYAYNFIRKVGNRKTYLALKKDDLWFSDRLSNKCKMLLIDLERQVVVYYNRALVLIYEDFKNGRILEYSSPVPNSEPVQLDYATNKSQKKIWGISSYSATKINFAAYSFVWN